MSDPRRSYLVLVGRIEEFFARAQKRYPDDILCREGCSDCCQRDLSLFPFEAQLIIAAARELPAEIRARVLDRARGAAAAEESCCPLLEDDRCLVYEARSVICRTHGLPALLDTARGKRELSLCPHNFQRVEHVDGDCVLDLNPVNQALALINHLACAELGVSPERVDAGQALLDELAPGEEP